MELKSIPGAIKGMEGRTVTGIVAVFGNVDTVQDRLWPGSFTKTINERRAKFRYLWNHDMVSPPTAVIDDIREVTREELPEAVLMAAPEASGGLEVKRTYLDTLRGNEVLAGIAAGAINEMSFGYDPIPASTRFTGEGDERVRELYEVRLWDTSDVLWGANEATTAAKFIIPMDLPLDLLLKQLEEAMSTKALRSAKDTTLLNAIHKAVVGLGATQCKGIAEEDEEESAKDEKQGRAGARELPPLTLLKSELDLLELEVFSQIRR